MPAIETKNLAGELDLKSLSSEGEFTGYLSTFGNIDQGGDVVVKGAFDRTLAEHKARGSRPKMLWQHDPSQPIGVWTEVELDDRGLKGKGRLLTETAKGKEAYVLAKNGAIEGISIGYRTRDYDRAEGGERLLKDLDLFEGSLVTFPMNIEANITGIKTLGSIRDVERVLRDAGVPNNFAKLVASHGYDEAKSLLERQQREAEAPEDFTEEEKSFLEMIRQMKEKLNA